ncbi:MAG: energy transducer TonB, partial [Planctomycetota bacterium]
ERGEYVLNRKHGEWKEFDGNGNVRRISTFENGRKISSKKVGRWFEYHENDEGIIGYDYDRKKEIRKRPHISIPYPESARDNEIQGVVKLKIVLDEQCNVLQMNVVQSLGYGCDEAALEGMKEFLKLAKKYTPKECQEIAEIIPIYFKLE